MLNAVAHKNLKKLLKSCQPTPSPSERPRKERASHNSKSALSRASNISSRIQGEENSGATGRDAASLIEDATAGDATSLDSRLRPLWELQEEDIILPSEIAESFEKWKADPSTFFHGGSSRIPSSPKEHYEYTRRACASLTSNKILWRFVTTTYFDVISSRSQSERYAITKEAVSYVVAVICESSTYEHNIVERDVINWVQQGKKYRVFANKLGGTACYFFYPDISEWM